MEKKSETKFMKITYSGIGTEHAQQQGLQLSITLKCIVETGC